MSEEPKKSNLFVIEGQEFNVVKRGRAQAEQVAMLGLWLSKHGKSIFDVVNASGSDSGIAIFMGVIEALTPDALIDLFVVEFGCSEEFADEYFDIALLIDGAVALYDNSDTVRNLVSRFFSGSTSPKTTKNPPTPSDVPTDGQTT